MTTATRPELTGRQRDILRFVARHWGTHGYPPSVRDIGAEFGISSPNGVECHLRALVRKGYLVRDTAAEYGESTARSVVVPELRTAAKAAADKFLATMGGE